MDHLLHELPEDTNGAAINDDMESSRSSTDGITRGSNYGAANDRTPLLQHDEPDSGHLPQPPRRDGLSSSDSYRADSDIYELDKVDDPTKPLAGLNALEIAAVASAKKFLSQRLVQKVVQDIWDGKIIFWENLSVNAIKKARVYNKR
jgi:hypothetical protein